MASTPDVKIANRTLVYKQLWTDHTDSIAELSKATGISLPTVTANINELAADGLIRTVGLQESTGGRKANLYELVADARTAIGVEVFADHSYICLLDIYGKVIADKLLEVKYKDTAEFYSEIGHAIAAFEEKHCPDKKKVLGIAIAMQGVVSSDHKTVVYGKILNNSGVLLDEFSKYYDLPSLFYHDSESAAFAESFYKPSLRAASYVLLNRNLGSGLIMNGEIYGGNHSRGQLLEHMRLVPNGTRCYCGQKGCAESYCSAGGLEAMAGEELELFFAKLRKGDIERKRIWNKYLTYLGMLIVNVLMVIDVDIVIGGEISLFMNLDDMKELKAIVRKRSDFEITDRTIALQVTGKYAAARGAGLRYIKNFISNPIV